MPVMLSTQPMDSPTIGQVGNNLTAPTNVTASVYSETSAEVFWERAASNLDLPIQYQLFLDGESAGQLEGTSLFFDDLLSGTEYEVRIDAIAGSARSSSQSIIFVTAGVFRLTPVGRPVEDASTHGFGFWDNMTLEQQQRWPSDCLFAGNQISRIEFGTVPGYCFSPFRRELINPARFRFSLPGDNETNHVEAIEWVNASALVLVTDVTTEFAQSKFEVSYFQQSGAFRDTFPILESIVSPVNGRPTRAINLDGKDVREIRDGSTRSNPANGNIYVIGEYYERNGTGRDTELSGWTNMGSFASKISTTNGSLISDAFFPGRSQESITRDDLPDFFGF